MDHEVTTCKKISFFLFWTPWGKNVLSYTPFARLSTAVNSISYMLHKYCSTQLNTWEVRGNVRIHVVSFQSSTTYM